MLEAGHESRLLLSQDVCLKIDLRTYGGVGYAQLSYQAGDAFVFGGETSGLPAGFLASFPPERLLRIPMRPGNRSLNLSNSVAVVLYEAWRQLDFGGGR